MKIDLGSTVVYEVTLGEQNYKLREPTVLDIKLFQADSKNNEDQVGCFVNFLANLGLPKEVSEGMGISKMEKLTEALISSIGKKN